ncbi:MAG: hypothetical protein L0196_01655 [candidate division Zixibacteria bacterium]|nr:hypothetical protein [candidate division Zixibacteria bacterium]
MGELSVRESQVEDVLAIYPDIAREILDFRDELTLLSRQKILPSGNKLDLLFASGRKLVLLELKVENFQTQFLNQTINYREELIGLQKKGKLLDGPIEAYLLCPFFSSGNISTCEKESVIPVRYLPEKVLMHFFARLRELANFITLKPSNHGLWNLKLLNRLLYLLISPRHTAYLVEHTRLSRSTVGSYLRLANELKLVQEYKDGTFVLTDLGQSYFRLRDKDADDDNISDEQAKVLQEFIIKDPFASPAIFGIYSIVDVVFTLSKNTYPVSQKLVVNYFRDTVGKNFEWSHKAASDAARMYSNYAAELGLVGRIGGSFFITPNGTRFIILLQLHKSIKVVDALQTIH